MNSDDLNKPISPSDEALLHLLEAAPRRLRWEQSPVDEDTPSCTGQASPECPGAGNYLRLAMGGVEESEAERLLTHASACALCATHLESGLHALEGNPSSEELAAINELAAAKLEWQKALARKLSGTSARRHPTMARSVLKIAAMVAVLLIAAALFVWRRQTQAPEHQLALAYTRSRTLELRIPDAEFSALVAGSHTRGGSESEGNVFLLEARAQLARLLARSPQEPRALQLRARADVLDEHYDSAVDVLDRLLAVGPVTSELLVDSASAYYQRGVVAGSELDRSTALDYLRRADEMAPTDPVVLFNEAIVMEDRGQIMNAVEVWNRFITVERDTNWAAEGRRKLTALEQTLNKLKTHDSRVEQMLATPEAMDALAGDPQKLATFDEELMYLQLDKLLPLAYPVSQASSKEAQQSRGSPCNPHCQASRRLLKALAVSLESQHKDYWLTDLLAPDIDILPAPTAYTYEKALNLLAQATREDQTGIRVLGRDLAQQSQALFLSLDREQNSDPKMHRAAWVGELRAGAEYAMALQSLIHYEECRDTAKHLRTQPRFTQTIHLYPWVDLLAQITEKVCSDTPETRVAGRALSVSALRLAEDAHYPMMKLRIEVRTVDDAQNMDDGETAEGVTLSVLRQIYAADMPPFRVTNTIGTLGYIEEDSPRAYMAESAWREAVGWSELAGNHINAAMDRTRLAHSEIRIGDLTEAENQLQKASEEARQYGRGVSRAANFSETATDMAQAMLERGDLTKAAHFVQLAQEHIANSSDSWSLRRFAAAQGMLALAEGHYAAAADLLETNIRTSEGKNVRKGDRATVVEYAQLDHDLYADLAASWLAQGRSAASVLALWERFRLRTHGLPITDCPANHLDCEQPQLVTTQRNLAGNLLTGQILLLDRVLVYRVGKDNIEWTQHPLRRQDVLTAAQTLERAVSSPLTSSETAKALGGRLSTFLLPALPKTFNPDATLLIEPDPLLQNLPWPVLATPTGALGLQYPLAESHSLLANLSATRNAQARPQILRISATTPASGLRPLVIGASIASEGEPPLPEAQREAALVGKFLRSPTLLLGQEATAVKVAESIGSASSFHFAGHAVQTVNGTRLLLAAIDPSDSTPWIDGTFLRQHPPRSCRLAVLSACATGSHAASWTHPLQDMVETLVSLGVPNVVATRWQIDSAATVPFMDAFYESLSKGHNTAFALTVARRLQSSQSQYNNPYYWGAYYLSSTEYSNARITLNASRQVTTQASKAD